MRFVSGRTVILTENTARRTVMSMSGVRVCPMQSSRMHSHGRTYRERMRNAITAFANVAIKSYELTTERGFGTKIVALGRCYLLVSFVCSETTIAASVWLLIPKYLPAYMFANLHFHIVGCRV